MGAVVSWCVLVFVRVQSECVHVCNQTSLRVSVCVLLECIRMYAFTRARTQKRSADLLVER